MTPILNDERSKPVLEDPIFNYYKLTNIQWPKKSMHHYVLYIVYRTGN